VVGDVSNDGLLKEVTLKPIDAYDQGGASPTGLAGSQWALGVYEGIFWIVLPLHHNWRPLFRGDSHTQSHHTTSLKFLAWSCTRPGHTSLALRRKSFGLPSPGLRYFS
jgi:hypothetical protein